MYFLPMGVLLSERLFWVRTGLSVEYLTLIYKVFLPMGVLLSERLFWVRTGLSGGPGDWPGDSYCAGAKNYSFFPQKTIVHIAQGYF